MPLFFICSGYLYQKYSKVNSVGSWCKNVSKKALALGVPYATFMTATWILKKLFSSNVNDQIGGLGDTLFLHPTAPYWYLYALFFIFLVTPTISSVKAAAVGLIVALAAKVLILTGGYSVYAVSTVLSNEIWFVFGMSICAFNVQLKSRKVQGTIFGLLFIILSIVVYAAPTRSVLLKLGIENAVFHVVLGLGISFVGPIIAAWIMKKTKWLEFFLYPNRVLQRK